MTVPGDPAAEFALLPGRLLDGRTVPRPLPVHAKMPGHQLYDRSADSLKHMLQANVMRYRSRVIVDTWSRSHAQRMDLDVGYVPSRSRRSGNCKSRSGNTQRQKRGNDDESPDVHATSEAIPQVSYEIARGAADLNAC